MILGLHPVDIAVIIASLLGVMAIGVVVSRNVNGESDFFVGGRKLGPVLQFFINFGNMTDSNGAPMVASEVYRQGAAGMWVPFQPLFSTPFYWFQSIWWRRTRLITGPDQFVERFNSTRLAAAFALWLVTSALLSMALGNMVSYKVAAAMFVKPAAEYSIEEKAQVEGFKEYAALKIQVQAKTLPTDKTARYEELKAKQKAGEISSYVTYISPLPFYIGYSLIVLVCVLLGGIKAAAYTDILQGLLIIAFSIMIIPIGLIEIGGFSGLHDKVPDYMFRVFGTEGLSDYTWYSVTAFVIMGLVCIGGPSGCGSGRDERSIRIGVFGGAFAKRFIMMMWMFCGLLAVAIFGQGGISDPDNTWGVLSTHLLPVGLMGLMVSGILLGHMPSVGKQAIDASAAFTRNLFEPYVPASWRRHNMLVAKLSIVATLSAGIGFSLIFDGIISLFTMLVSVGALYGAMGLLILFWRPLSARGTAVGWVLWLLFLMVLPFTLPRFEAVRTAPSLVVETAARDVDYTALASSADVTAGRATATGQALSKTQHVEPVAIYYEAVKTVNGVRQGGGRFHIELWVLSQFGMDFSNFSRAGLNTARWLFDSFGPFLTLIACSLLLPDRRRRAANDAERQVPDPSTYARTVMEGNLVTLRIKDETAEQAAIRTDRFFAKLKTPIGASPEADEAELARTFADPSRFDRELLFPGKVVEFTRWTRYDVMGFFGIWIGVLTVIGILFGILRIGG